jgi:hypothetical protein
LHLITNPPQKATHKQSHIAGRLRFRLVGDDVRSLFLNDKLTEVDRRIDSPDCLTLYVSTMAKRITGRQLRHGAPEENLSPGESVVIEKRGGKKFELTRIDKGSINFNEQMDRVFREIPAEGKRVKTNLARTLLEDRE